MMLEKEGRYIHSMGYFHDREKKVFKEQKGN